MSPAARILHCSDRGPRTQHNRRMHATTAQAQREQRSAHGSGYVQTSEHLSIHGWSSERRRTVPALLRSAGWTTWAGPTHRSVVRGFAICHWPVLSSHGTPQWIMIRPPARRQAFPTTACSYAKSCTRTHERSGGNTQRGSAGGTPASVGRRGTPRCSCSTPRAIAISTATRCGVLVATPNKDCRPIFLWQGASSPCSRSGAGRNSAKRREDSNHRFDRSGTDLSRPPLMQRSGGAVITQIGQSTIPHMTRMSLLTAVRTTRSDAGGTRAVHHARRQRMG